jgi:hypothetical protein
MKLRRTCETSLLSTKSFSDIREDGAGGSSSKLIPLLEHNNNSNSNTVPHSHQSPKISSERHEANKNLNNQEPEGKMGSKKTAWTVSTEP